MIACPVHNQTVGKGLLPYYYYRCQHEGDRYVVETRRQPTWGPDDTGYFAVDYVERPGTGDIRVEAHNAPTESEADVLWEALVMRLEAGDPPKDVGVH
jgi:hypothetical protein